MSERRRERSRSRERRHHSSHRRDERSRGHERSHRRDDHRQDHGSRDGVQRSDDHQQRDRRTERDMPSQRRPEQRAGDLRGHHDQQRRSRHDSDHRHDERRGGQHVTDERDPAQPQAGAHDGHAVGPAHGAAVLDAMVPTPPAGTAEAAADSRQPQRRPRPGAPPGHPQRPAPGQQQQQQQPQQNGVLGQGGQPAAQQPVRINPHGMYARAIEDTDYIVPRGGYFFEHDDRDVVTFKEELRRPRNGGAPRQAAAGGAGRGAPDAGGSFIVEDPGDRWDDRGPQPPRQRGRDWVDSEAAEPMDRQRRQRRDGVSEGIFGLHRNSDFRGGSWQGGRGRGSGFGGFGGGGGGKWGHDMFEALNGDKADTPDKTQTTTVG